MSGKKKDFPNKWKAIQKAPAEYFEPCLFEEFKLWRLNSWEVNDDFLVIIRAQHKHSGKVKEHVYKQQKAADNCLLKYLEGQEHDITVCSNEAMHHVEANDFLDFYLDQQ